MMDEEGFRHILSEIKPYTKYVYFHLMGEPLCHPKLPDFIKLASADGFKCAVTTNGTLLKNREEELLNSGVYKINVSLHGFENSADKEKYLENCISFADKASKKGILTVFRLWNGEGGFGENEDTLALLKESFPGEEWAMGARGARIRDKLHLEYGERFEWPDLSCADMGDDVFCYGLSDHFGILSNGSVVPCCLDSDGTMTLGNVFKESLDTILSSARAKNIIEGFKSKKAREELCRKCGYARRFKV